jgi:hypothetical protein
VAASAEGRRLTEQHRQDQLALRAAFLQQFLQLWPLLDENRLDETSPGWVAAVMGILRPYRRRSAEIATNYFTEYRQAEVPDLRRGPARSTPGLARPAQTPPEQPQRVGTAGRRGPARPVTRLRPSGSRPGGNVQIPDLEDGPRERTRIDIPEIDWEPFSYAAEISLKVMGPVGQKSKTGRGMTPAQAKDVSFVQTAGAASRHVLTGGRQSLLTLVDRDTVAKGWIRVTDSDPCSFCAMLASRGPVFKDKAAFAESNAQFQNNPKLGATPGDAKVHDNCACTMEPVYSLSAPWPGRAKEFRALYNEVIGFAPNNRYHGAEALRVFRNEYERRRRVSQRESVA